MLLAELEVWHTRPRAPTRRIALGTLVLPVDPAPGFGGVLLGAVIARHVKDVDEDFVPDVHRLIDQIDRGDRVVQPRLRHRYQVDRHGLGRSVHRLFGDGDELHCEFDSHGSPLAMVLGAVYAVERLDTPNRHVIAPVLHKAMRWRGPVGPALIAHPRGHDGDDAGVARRSAGVGPRCPRVPGRVTDAIEEGGDRAVPDADALGPSGPRR